MDSHTHLTPKNYFLDFQLDFMKWLNARRKAIGERELPYFPIIRSLSPEIKEWNLMYHELTQPEDPIRDHKVKRKARMFVDVQEAIESIQWERSNTGAYFVTYNPKPGISLPDLMEHVSSIAQDNKIQWAYVVYETSTKGHIHAHMLCRSKKLDKNFVNRVLKRAWQKICGNTKAIDVRFPSKDDLQAVYEYMLKTEDVRSKKLNAMATLKWRLDNKLDPVYKFGDAPLLVSASTNDS